MSAPNKVTIILHHTGSAPVLKKESRKVTIDEEEPLSKVIAYIRKVLGLTNTDSLFVFLKSSFAPDPREKVGVLTDAFGSTDSNGSKSLSVQYSLTLCWG